ncbi:MAG: transporter [Hirschia sp.]|nr:transporter [Hirschia sp.]MBF19508.1 transporter [Hirschia sp.]
MKNYSSLAAALLVTGCAGISSQRAELGDYREASLPDAPNEWAVTLPAPAAESDWIAQFSSGVLAELIEEAMQANPDVASAVATADAARAGYRAARGRALPSVTGGSENSYSGLVEEFDQGTEAYSLGITASWEPDLWGRVSRRVRAADADYIASNADLSAIRLSITGATARAWISLVNARAQLILTQDELRVRQNSAQVTERRLSAGVATALDVRLARSAVASTRASIASAEQSVSDAARSLEILLGRYPAAAVESPDVPPQLDAMVDLSNPTDLLARRPDIAAAEARMAAAGMRAELARLALLPSLSIGGSTTFSSDEIADLIDVEQLAGRVFANLTAPIFNGGALKADAEAAIARARASISDYAGVVLNAWREVEAARAADISLEKQEIALAEALTEAEAAETLAERQYQRGLITIFNLIDAQTRRISAERQLLNVRANRAANRINYHIALGGGALPLADLPNADMSTEGSTAP